MDSASLHACYSFEFFRYRPIVDSGLKISQKEITGSVDKADRRFTSLCTGLTSNRKKKSEIRARNVASISSKSWHHVNCSEMRKKLGSTKCKITRHSHACCSEGPLQRE